MPAMQTVAEYKQETATEEEAKNRTDKKSSEHARLWQKTVPSANYMGKNK